MARLPNVLVDDILSRLPIKSLMKFKSVSHAWNTRIRSPAFAKFHKKQEENKNSIKVMIYTRDLVDFYSVSVQFDDDQGGGAIENIPHKFDPDFSYFRFSIMRPYKIVGSCDGLLLVVVQRPYRLCIWNPSIRECKDLPSGPNHISAMYGFYSVTSSDVKIHDDYNVLVLHNSKGETFSEILLYTTRTSSWRKLRNIPYYYYRKSSSLALVNAKLHCFAESVDGTRVILAFDVADELFQEVPQPDYNGGIPSFVGELNGHLCVFSMNKNMNYVWLMKEYGVKESWTKLVTNRPLLIPERPLHFSKDGQILLRNNRKSVLSILCDESRNHEEKTLKLDIFWDILFWKTYLQTIISPNAI